ncbi:MAG: aminotransferase class I/II-fold pyridoxal phosphate-dependent enzyme [Deltaproteobacteria bacterium]|nr:aminotransferase class I/II-fold pyridoxal phosphate-dependent enzyme [Deltaproteobacteria bacterium]
MISKRSLSIDSSGIRRVFDLAQKIKDPINLSIGQPDFDASEQVKSAAKQAIDSGKNTYTLTQGISALRQEVASQYGLDLNLPDAQNSVIITSGVSGGLLLSYLAVLDPGDEILIPDPFFCMYRDLAKLINAQPVYYDCYPEFKLPLEEIESKVSPRTKAIIINTPCNPTGSVTAENELTSLIEILRKKNILLIYDEIYSCYSYDQTHVNVFGRYEQTIILNGFSKSHAIPGWRVGYAVGAAALINEMCKIQQYSFVCAPSIAQYSLAGNVTLENTSITDTYRAKRDFICSALAGKYEFVQPRGAFYLFPKAPGSSGQAFVEKCIENKLLVVPGNVFSERDSHFRISFAAPLATLERGAKVLLKLA